MFAGLVTTLAGSTTSGSIDGVGSASKFYGPSGVTVNIVVGLLFVADYYNHKIRVINTITGNPYLSVWFVIVKPKLFSKPFHKSCCLILYVLLLFSLSAPAITCPRLEP